MNGHDSIRTLELVVEIGATASTPVDLKGHVPIAIITPAAVTSTTAEIQASLDGSTWLPVYDREDTKYAVALGTSRWIALPPSDIAGLPEVRLVVGTAEAADRTFKLICRALG